MWMRLRASRVSSLNAASAEAHACDDSVERITQPQTRSRVDPRTAFPPMLICDAMFYRLPLVMSFTTRSPRPT